MSTLSTRPRETASDPRERLEAAVRRARARYVEIRFERADTTTVAFRGRFQQACSPSRMTGGIVRALAEGGWGVSTFNDIGRLDEAVSDACAAASLIAGPRVELAGVAPVQLEHDYSPEVDPRGISLGEKRALMETYNEQLLATDPRIVETIALYRECLRDSSYVTSEGTSIRRSESIIDLTFRAVARDGQLVQLGRRGDAFRDTGFEVVRDREGWVMAAAGDALANLDAEQIEGGAYTVILDPQLTGLFTHEAFGHLSEADHHFQNPELQQTMRKGRVFGRPILNIYDSGVESEVLLGSVAVDDEGVPTQRTDLVREGELVGHLHSRETAARMGAEATGNARAQTGLHAPIVRMRNTAIAPGDTPFSRMVGEVERGLYAVGGAGGQTRLGNYSFTAQHGFLIEGGRLARRVRDIVLSGNIFETLGAIDAIGDDPGWTCGGRCGKQGQSMTVGMGGPHVRIERVVIGGA